MWGIHFRILFFVCTEEFSPFVMLEILVYEKPKILSCTMHKKSQKFSQSGFTVSCHMAFSRGTLNTIGTLKGIPTELKSSLNKYTVTANSFTPLYLLDSRLMPSSSI